MPASVGSTGYALPGGGGGGVPTSRKIDTTAPLAGGGDLTVDRTHTVSDFVASGPSHARGTVPDPGAVAGTTKFLREDATWATTPAGGSPPTGTGFRHITGGVEDAAAKLVDTADVTDDAVTYAKMQNVSATDRFLGRKTAGAGDTEELTGTEATARLDAFTSALKGLAPASGGGTTNFLRADATWAAPPVGGSPPTGTGFRHITAGVEDAAAKLVDTADVNANQITDAKLRQGAATSVIGRSAGSLGDVADIAASVNSQYLQRAGGVLTFAAIPVADLPQHDHTGTTDGGILTGDIHDGFSEYVEIASPANPAADRARVFGKARQGITVPTYRNQFGQEYDLSTIPRPVYRWNDDDFLGALGTTGNIGRMGWVLGAGTVAGKAGVANHSGILTLLSSATNNTIGRLVLGPVVVQTCIIPQDMGYMCFVCRPVTSIATSKMRFGLILTPATSGEGSDGIYFSFDSAASTFIRTVTKSAGVGTVNTSAVTWTLNNWYMLEIMKNGSNYEFWINNALAFTHSTNIPTAAETAIIAIETNSAATKDLDCDYWAMATIAPLGQQWT